MKHAIILTPQRRKKQTMEQNKKERLKKIVSLAGTALMIVSLGFIGRRLFGYLTAEDFDRSFLSSSTVIMGLLGVALVEGLGIFLAGINFRSLIRNVSGISTEPTLSATVYTSANLYKYIPGGVLYVAGRNRLAVETEGLGHGKVAFATVVEGALVAVAAILVAVLNAYDHTVSYLRYVDVLPIIGIIVAIIVLALIPIIYIFRQKISTGWKYLTSNMEELTFLVVFKRFGFALLLMALWGGSFAATLALLGQSMNLGLVSTIVGLFILSWVAGFLTPGAPSGLGIREAVMLMFMGGVVDGGLLIIAMIIHRVLTVMGDLIAYGIAIVYRRLAFKTEPI